MTTAEQNQKVEAMFIAMVKAEMAMSGNDWNESKASVKEWMRKKGLM
jgi:uncharacterized protein (DUF2147 family)